MSFTSHSYKASTVFAEQVVTPRTETGVKGGGSKLANINDWVVIHANGDKEVVSNAEYVTRFV